MAKRQNNRLFWILVGVVILLTISAVLLFTADCGSSEGWIGEGGADSQASSSIEGIHASPAFHSGQYTLTSSVVYKETDYDSNGTTLYYYTETSRYGYLLDITAKDDGSAECRFTFSDIYCAVNQNGTTSVELNTADPAAYDEALSPFYELLGQSFTVATDAEGKPVSLDGYAAIMEAVPEVTQIIDEETLAGMVCSLFYPMPAAVSDSVSFDFSFSGMKGKSTAKRLENGYFCFEITGSDVSVPDPSTDSDGNTISYTSVRPYSGTLLMGEYDRAVQQLAVSQGNSGIYSDAQGYGCYFDIDVTTTYSVSPAQ